MLCFRLYYIASCPSATTLVRLPVGSGILVFTIAVMGGTRVKLYVDVLLGSTRNELRTLPVSSAHANLALALAAMPRNLAAVLLVLANTCLQHADSVGTNSADDACFHVYSLTMLVSTFLLLPKLARGAHGRCGVCKSFDVACWKFSHSCHPLELLKADMTQLVVPRKELFLVDVDILVVFAC